MKAVKDSSHFPSMRGSSTAERFFSKVPTTCKKVAIPCAVYAIHLFKSKFQWI